MRRCGGLAARLAGQPLDVLINNAGVLQSIPLDHLDFDSIRYQFEVNAIGTLRLTQALLPNLSEGSKLILMTSRMGSIGDNTSGGVLWLSNVQGGDVHGGEIALP